MDVAAELGRNLVSKHQIQPEYGDEQTDAGRDCRTCLARPNSQARTRTEKYYFFPVQLITSRIGNLTRLIRSLVMCDDHTCIHTVYIIQFSTNVYKNRSRCSASSNRDQLFPEKGAREGVGEGRQITRDGTAEPVSRGQILRREQEQENVHFSLFS